MAQVSHRTRKKRPLYGHTMITIATLTSLVLVLVLVCIDDTRMANIPLIAFSFMIFWLSAAIVFAVLTFKEFVSGFLLCLFSMLIAWRISGIYNIVNVSYPLVVTFALLLANFIYCVHQNLKFPAKSLHPLSLYIWQLIFIRMYIGFDFIPHFTEKLFAGDMPRSMDVSAFVHLGVPHASFFVYLAGLCEFAAAIGLSVGLLMRIGSLGAALYLTIATYLGHHFLSGFIWAGPGGGWEFAVMWIMLIISFALTGAHEFSIDQVLEDHFHLPPWLKKFL